MKIRHLFPCSSIYLFLCLWSGFSQSENSKTFYQIDVSDTNKTESVPFFSGLNGYHSFRIPALIKTKSVLLAFAEGRKNSTSDFGDIDLVYRRSLDNGKSWEPLQLLYNLDTMAVQNPSPVYLENKNKVVLSV